MSSGRHGVWKPLGPFTLPQLARLTGLPVKTLGYWASTGFLAPSVQATRGTGTWRLFSFQDAVALRAVAELYGAGVSLHRLRRIREYLASVDKLDHPFAEARLVAKGDDVLRVIEVLEESDAARHKKAWSLLKKPGQGVFGFMIDLPTLAREVREEAARATRENEKAQKMRKAAR